MENENSKKKTTAPDTSVGADDGQPLRNSTENSISAFDEEINGDFQNNSESLDEIYRRIQRLTDPHYLHTISMTELYQTAYQSRPPIIDGLLYAGAYILAGAPKIGKSFLVAQIAYHVSTGKALGLRSPSRYGAVPCLGGRFSAHPEPDVHDVRRQRHRPAALCNCGGQDRKRAGRAA